MSKAQTTNERYWNLSPDRRTCHDPYAGRGPTRHSARHRSCAPECGRAAATALDTVATALAAAPIALHFHPERRTARGLTVAKGLLADGLYQSQFVTGISNGSPTAFPGRLRDMLETTLSGVRITGVHRTSAGCTAHLTACVMRTVLHRALARASSCSRRMSSRAAPRALATATPSRFPLVSLASSSRWWRRCLRRSRRTAQHLASHC